MVYRAFLLFCLSFSCGVDFNFKISLETPGMSGFPPAFDNLLSNLATPKNLSMFSISKLTLPELVDQTAGPYWDFYVLNYFLNNKIPLDVVSIVQNISIDDLINNMPRFDLQDFWSVSLKVLIFQVSMYLEPAGTEDVISLLKNIYKEDPKSVFSEVLGLNISQPYLLYTYPYMKQILLKLQYNQTLRVINAFGITPTQLTVLSFDLFDVVNEKMANEVFCKIHKQNSTLYHNNVVDVLVRIQLYRSSFYHWSLLCKQTMLTDSQETLDNLSKRCFNQDFSKVAFILYDLSPENSNIFRTLTVEESSFVANRTLFSSTLIPVQDQLIEMKKRMDIVNVAKTRCFILLSNENGISQRTMIYFTISEILTRIHALPWTVLIKMYAIEDFVALKAKFIDFQDLPKLINGENKNTNIDVKFLQLQTLQLILNTLAGNINSSLLYAQFKESFILMSKYPLSRFAAIFDFSQDYVMNATLTSLTSEAFNLNSTEFLENYRIASAEYNFFQSTRIKDMGLLLKLERNDLILLTITQLIASMKLNIYLSNIMLMTPVALAATKNKNATEILQYSVPQIVHQFKNDVIKTMEEFLDYVKEWSKSDSASLILTEKDLHDLGVLLSRPALEVANLRVIDIINAILDSFGAQCDPQNLYCKKLQNCVKTLENDYRCQCQLGYRFSGPTECSDLNECLYTNVTCNKNADCINTQGSYSCKCKPGFDGDGRFCDNINECLIGSYNCSNNTSCLDTEGSYKCVCNLGFIENKENQCSDINECLLNTYNCHVNGECINTIGSYVCQCRKGLKGDGVTSCLDVNECETGDFKCTPNSWCSNTIGSYKCVCNSGYFEENGFCQQCSDVRTTCHQYADCYKEIFDSFRCICKAGFSGNGTYCQDINECENNNPCGMGQCKNFIGSYSCLCDPGFRSTFDNKKCIDVDECKESLNLGISLCNKSEQECENKEGSYACVTNSFNKSAIIGLSVAIPLIVIIVILIVGVYFIRRKIKAEKELSNFDQKLEELNVNKGYEKGGNSERMRTMPNGERGIR